MKVETMTEVRIIMNKSEAEWLKNIMQNAIHEDESIAEKTRRKMFWNILDAEGIRTV